MLSPACRWNHPTTRASTRPDARGRVQLRSQTPPLRLDLVTTGQKSLSERGHPSLQETANRAFSPVIWKVSDNMKRDAKAKEVVSEERRAFLDKAFQVKITPCLFSIFIRDVR